MKWLFFEGERGWTGPTGPTSERGERGPTGSTGPTGKPGDKFLSPTTEAIQILPTLGGNEEFKINVTKFSAAQGWEFISA